MYKKANRFMNSRIGIDTSMSSRKRLGPIKSSRQELLLCAGMKAPNEADFMNRIQSELNKLVAKGIKSPRLQAERLNKAGMLTAIGYRWDAARVVTFYERQKTRRTSRQQTALTIKYAAAAPNRPGLLRSEAERLRVSAPLEAR